MAKPKTKPEGAGGQSAIIEQIPTAELIPYTRNSRTHSELQVQQIAGSIQEFGFCNPVLIDAENGIIAGHGRVMAAHLLKLATVPCLRLTHLTDAQKRAYVIADNRLALNSAWDTELLANELSDLHADDFDMGLLGFDADELETLLGFELTDQDAGEIVEDEVPEPPVDPITKLGDLWILGEHRLLCGDSTKAGDVGRLMGGIKADMMFTDPPYGISLGVETPEQAKAHNRRTDGKTIENDDLKGERLAEFLASSLAIVDHHLRPGGAFYVCSPIGVEVRKFIQAIEAARWHYQTGLVWNKNSLSLSRFDYQPKHEIIHYGWKGGAAHKWRSDRTQTSVIDHAKPSKSEDHPTTKPTQLVAYFISNVSDGSDIVLDPFLGSGTTLIAAEQLNRKCYGMEISPQYCDVIVKRWENLTGKTAVLETPGGQQALQEPQQKGVATTQV